ncbi:MAG: ankyrin repeat domain-containing protein [Candidatus Micrarchaeia archaeon]
MESKRVSLFKGRKNLEMLVHMREGKLLFKKADLCTDKSLMDVPVEVQMANASLMHAARNNLLEKGREALISSANPNIYDKFGFTPLFWALANRNEDFALMLLLYDASIHMRNPLGETPLMVASYFGMCGVIKEIIIKGAELNARNLYRMTALMCAAQGGSENAVALLISAGANPLLKDSRHLSALDYARYLKHRDVEMLLRAVCTPGRPLKTENYLNKELAKL